MELPKHLVVFSHINLNVLLYAFLFRALVTMVHQGSDSFGQAYHSTRLPVLSPFCLRHKVTGTFGHDPDYRDWVPSTR